MNVSAILKGKGRNVLTARPDAKLQDVAKVLAAKKIGAVLVMGRNGCLDGIISERDIIRAIADRGPDCLSEPVSNVMTRAVETCEAGETLDELMGKMTAGRFRHLPVMEDGALIGIVSIGDVVKHHIAEVEFEASALRHYIVA
jgi:CBS domain-containing protein